MLMEASDSPDPSSFRESEIFKKCQEIGIIPASEADLAQKADADFSAQRVAHMDGAAGGAGNPGAVSKAQTLDLNLLVSDMWCPACGWVIEETLKRTRGIVHATCDFFTDMIQCQYDPSLISPSQITGAIEDLGYQTCVPGEERESDEKHREFVRFVVSAFLTTNVMMLSFALYSGFFTELPLEAIRKISWPLFFMTTVVLFYGGKRVFQRAWTGMTSPGAGMETLIAAGSFSAFAYSTFNLLSGNIHLYYDTACMLITLFLLGKTLERRAKHSIQGALSNIWSLQPTKVRIRSDLNPEGRYVSIKQLKPGDHFHVAEDEDVPADGLIMEGKGLVDESSLTGEATPVPKKPGHRLLSGTRITQGTFTVKADRIGENSTVGQMVKIMEKALGTKTYVEGRTDQLLRYFVPTVLILATGTGIACLLNGISADQSMLRAVTVMVISCPCALGLAIPLARVAGISLSGKRGILVRDFSAFERAQQVNSFVFDKTGTMTTGQWSLLQVIPFEPFIEKHVLGMAASLEKMSEHYIAMEIRREAEKQDLTLVDVQNIKAFENGISGEFKKVDLKIGSRAFLSREVEQSGSMVFDNLPRDDSLYSVVFMSYDGRVCAAFVFGDMIKESAFDTARDLLERQYHVSLISGDGKRTTEAIGQRIGITSCHGGKLPLDKVAFVERLQEEGQTVTMIGDGINDAPALVQADLAIAVHSGGHLGQQTADITLMRGDPGQVLDFLDLGQIVNRKIKQNLVYSSSYNLIGIPIAMSGLLNPLIAVCAMLMSSLSVLGNTLLLLKRRPEL
jgi:heavy metal translocating P-type ATPase